LKSIARLYTLIYSLYLKIFYARRVELKGRIHANGFFGIEVARGAKLTIEGDVTFKSGTLIGVRKNASLRIGTGCFFNRNCSIICRDSISIGKDCLFGESVRVYDHDHRIAGGNVSKSEYTLASVTIGDDCWLANDVDVLKGSRIPDGCVIAAKGVVNRPLDSKGIYAGIPVEFKKALPN
jgi:acetyltransferase-like isoleucine patch superfamily enzyme